MTNNILDFRPLKWVKKLWVTLGELSTWSEIWMRNWVTNKRQGEQLARSIGKIRKSLVKLSSHKSFFDWYKLLKTCLIWWFLHKYLGNLKVSKRIFTFLKSIIHFKKTFARSSFLSKLWYFQYNISWLCFDWKVPQFWKKWGSRNCLLKMNGL